MQKMVGENLGRTPPKMKRGPDPAACRRRDHPGSVADKGYAIRGPRRDEAAARNASHPPGDDACAPKAEDCLGLAEKGAQMRAAAAAGRKSCMEYRRPRRDPGQIARREFGIKKAMQEARIGFFQAVILDLDTGKETLVAPKPEATRDSRLRSVGPKNVPGRNIDARKHEKIALPFGPIKCGSPQDLRACAHRLLGQPVEEPPGLRRQKKAAWREQIDVLQIGRVKANAVHPPRERVRDVDFFRCFVEENSRGLDAMSRRRLRLKNGDLQATHGGGFRGGKSSETGADNHKIIRLWSTRHVKSQSTNS